MHQIYDINLNLLGHQIYPQKRYNFSLLYPNTKQTYLCIYKKVTYKNFVKWAGEKMSVYIAGREVGMM